MITGQGATTVKYELYRLLRWAREDCDRLARLEIADNPVWHGPPGAQGYAKHTSEVGEVFGFFKGDALKAAVILNILEHEVSLEIPGLERAKGGLTLTQESLLPGWGNRDNPPVDKWNPPSTLRKLGVAARRVTVPPHSISVIHLERELEPR